MYEIYKKKKHISFNQETEKYFEMVENIFLFALLFLNNSKIGFKFN